MTLSLADLDRIAATLTAGPAPGYPPHRLFLTTPGVHYDPATRTLHVPDGPWQVENHPNRRGAPPATHVAAAPGAPRDQHGRQVHPDWAQLLADPRIGLPTGLGYFWWPAENRTATALVYRRTPGGLEVLLVQRRDGQWALPGGFVEPGEEPQAAAYRETGEETGARDLGGRAELLLDARHPGPAATLHAWTRDALYLLHADPAAVAGLAPRAGDRREVLDARWAPARQAARRATFHRHGEFVRRGLKALAGPAAH